jgi:hypothetical protein
VNEYGGFDPNSYPHYTIARAKEIVEVIEFPKGPTFRIVDDPELIESANEAIKQGRCFQR